MQIWKFINMEPPYAAFFKKFFRFSSMLFIFICILERSSSLSLVIFIYIRFSSLPSLSPSAYENIVPKWAKESRDHVQIMRLSVPYSFIVPVRNEIFMQNFFSFSLSSFSLSCFLASSSSACDIVVLYAYILCCCVKEEIYAIIWWNIWRNKKKRKWNIDNILQNMHHSLFFSLFSFFFLLYNFFYCNRDMKMFSINKNWKKKERKTRKIKNCPCNWPFPSPHPSATAAKISLKSIFTNGGW